MIEQNNSTQKPMSLKMKRIFYAVCFIYAPILAGVFEVAKRNNPNFASIDVDVTYTYYYEAIVAVYSLLSIFLAFKWKSRSYLERLTFLVSPAFLVLIDYYFFNSSNLLYFLPMLAVAYIFMWPRYADYVEEEECNKEESNTQQGA